MKIYIALFTTLNAAGHFASVSVSALAAVEDAIMIAIVKVVLRFAQCDSNGQGCPRGYSCNQTSESSAGCYPCQRTRPGIGEEEEVNAVEGKDDMIGVSSFICGHHLPAMHFLVGCAICKRFCLEKRES
eukprot:scaffold5610_cov237-Skeletonema_marinoi.AAC.3